MAQSLEQRSLKREQIAVNRSSCTIEKGSHFQDSPKVKHKFSKPFLEPHGKYSQTKSSKHEIKFKSLENNRSPMLGSKVYNDDELVKHMSNVPCFLQQVGKEESIQEKALNFGVLDWKRLEKLKYNERMPVRIHKKTSSSSTISICMGSGPPKMSPNLRKQSSSHGLEIDSRFGSPQRKSLPSQNSHINPFKMERKDTCCREENSFEGIRQPGNLETQSQEIQGVQKSTVGSPQKFHHNVESYDSCWEPNLDKVKMEDKNEETIPERKPRFLEQGKHRISLSSIDTINVQRKMSEKSMDDGVNYTHMGFPAEMQNFLLVSKHFRERSCSASSQFTEPRMSLDGQLSEAIGNRISNCFSPQESRKSSENVIPTPSGAKTLITHEIIPKPSLLVDPRKKPDAKLPTVKARHPSPTSRFSFGHRKMSRSSSFKDSSAVPQLRSTYNAVRSGPMMEVTTGADSIDKEKASSSSKGRSSPLRRLLDPLLKKKESQSTNIIQPPNETMATRGLCPDRKSKGLSSRGLLQLSLKNGLPFFKLVVENSSNSMLAAFVQKLPAFGKSDHSMVYTLYSIHEVRKKNMTWIQGSKSKRCNLGCGILGQMKISSIRIPDSRAKSVDVCVVRECVLYGVDKEHVDEEEPEFLPGKEMAAVVLQNSCQKFNDNKKLYQDGSNDSAVVILPGGVHGMPNKGAPSSLISRWRSSGSCDCGGWDVGCKLRVLTNHNKKSHQILESSMSCSTKDRVDLFAQGREGREQNGTPAFNLEASSNGFYSLELDSTIPLLEAFATCVALLTNQNFSEMLEPNIPRDFLEAIVATCKPKTTTATTTPFSRQVPAMYATCRPPSPVGRI